MNFIFTEKFRPKKLKSIVLPKRIREIIGDGKLNQNYLFHSSKPGSGKTTLAKALAYQIDDGGDALYNSMYLNISDESSVEVIRTKIKDFAESSSLFDGGKYKYKVIILDEFDFASASFFAALRGVIEQYAETLRFVATCNYINKLPEPITSRFEVIDFAPQNEDEVEEVKNGIKKRLTSIFEAVKIEIDEDNLNHFVEKNFPDMRKMINKIQSYHSSGKKTINDKDFKDLNYSYQELFKKCISKPNPTEHYDYLLSKYSTKTDDVLVALSEEFIDWIKESNDTKLITKIPSVISTTAEYQYKRNFVINPTVNMLACFFDIQKIFN